MIWRDLRRTLQTSPYDPGSCRHSMIQIRPFLRGGAHCWPSAVTWRRRALGAADPPVPTRKMSGRRSSNVGKSHDPVHILIPRVARNVDALEPIMTWWLDKVAGVLAKAGANMCTGSWVLPTFDDRLPPVLRNGVGRIALPAAHRRQAVVVGQQCALPLRKCRIRIIECRQEPGSYGEVWTLRDIARVADRWRRTPT